LRKSKLSKSILSNSVVKAVIKINVAISIVMNLKLRIAKNIIFFFTSSYAKIVMKTFKIKFKTITMTISKNTTKLKS
jgi:hypothetical protein